MDKEQALHNFWSQFGIPAYNELSVPDKATAPYITYGVSTGSIDEPVSLHGSIWYKSPSWKDIIAKQNQIAENIGCGGKTIKIDGGYVYITRGTPFSQQMADPDDTIRRIYISITAEFLTAD